jgi:hypothetical protein
VPVRAFSHANEAQFYVSMSRARFAMHVFTDSKLALRDAVTSRAIGFLLGISSTWPRLMEL